MYSNAQTQSRDDRWTILCNIKIIKSITTSWRLRAEQRACVCTNSIFFCIAFAQQKTTKQFSWCRYFYTQHTILNVIVM